MPSIQVFLDEMNLLKIFRCTIKSPNNAWAAGRVCLPAHAQIRWQTTDIPRKEEPSVDVSTNVTAVKQSNLMEFFETKDKLYETKIIHGRILSVIVIAIETFSFV